MKKITILLTILTAFFIFSCEEPVENSGIDQESLLTSGKWNMLMFFDETTGDKSQNFRNCSFTFKSGGALEIVKSNTSDKGTWTIGAQENKKMNLSTSNPDYSALNNEWIVKNISKDQIALMRLGPNGTEDLIFSK